MEPIMAIVPTLNEAENLARTLGRLKGCGFEVIVADGGSGDGTVDVALDLGAQVKSSPPGRGRQMDAGAAAAGPGILFFVHADSRPPLDAGDRIRRILANPKISAGAFRLKIDSPDPRLRAVSAWANLRSAIFRLPYGDQGLFVRKEVFDSVGGFRGLPLMEDVDLIDRLRRVGRVVLDRAEMSTSARRWKKRGIWRTSLRNLACLWRYRRGVSAERLAREYYAPGSGRVS